MSSPEQEHRCWAEVDLSALQHNLAAIRGHISNAVQVMAVVKANAYGHGAEQVVRALRERVEMFGVANLTEARQIKAEAANIPIYILGPALPQERREIAASGFIPAISSIEEAVAYSDLARTGTSIPIHLTIDTGMGRIGIWQDEVLNAARTILGLSGVRICGVASHLPVADEDDAFTEAELEAFEQLVAAIRALGISSVTAHIENSAGLIGFPAKAGDLVRAGLMLYGTSPRPGFQSRLRPVLSWKSRVVLVRDVGAGRGISYGRTYITPHPMRIATVAVGYADGFQRRLSGTGVEVLIAGRRCAVLGRVTMDQIMVDVTGLPQIVEGEEVVLLGKEGSEEILASELAQKAGTIPWEIFTGIGARVTRVYT